MSVLRIAKAPLYKCPIGDGAAEPRVIWNREEKSWFMFYQQRDKESYLQIKGDEALSFCFGRDIAIASSKDNGATWVYRGIAEGLSFEPGRNSWGFPEVIWDGKNYHLFCQYVQGMPTTFGGPSQIVHYTSTDLWNWKFDKMIKEDDHRKNSICVHQLPSGKWRMYYNDNKILSMLESDNLYDWEYIGEGVDCKHNSPNIFKLGEYYWQTIDTYKGFAVFRSDDCISWEKQDYTLMSEKGTREDDGSNPHHSGVVELEDRAYMFYYTHPERIDIKPLGNRLVVDRMHGEPNLRRACIQVAMLEEKDGKLICSRNEPFDFFLPDMD